MVFLSPFMFRIKTNLNIQAVCLHVTSNICKVISYMCVFIDTLLLWTMVTNILSDLMQIFCILHTNKGISRQDGERNEKKNIQTWYA